MKAKLVRKDQKKEAVSTVRMKRVKPTIEYKKARPKKTVRGTMYA